MDERPTWSPTQHDMDKFSESPTFASTPPQREGTGTKPGNHNTSQSYNSCFIGTYHAHTIGMVMTWRSLENPVAYVFTLH